MPDVTTIKVPRALRDRLAVRAAAQRTTLAGAIAQALDDSDERHFWDQVQADHEVLTSAERLARAGDATLTDDLADAADDSLRGDDW